MGEILDKYTDISEIKDMDIKKLYLFSEELREFLIDKVSKSGGHLASNLGVVELTISLYNVFDFNKDKLIWDVGHQSYVHKILTGRRDEFDTLRQFGGLSGFPKKEESPYDFFETGHSSTSISAALGMARARDLKGEKYDVVAVIGDGALTGGMALEALNDAGGSKTKIIIILNDNQMSIGKNVGGLSSYLGKIRFDPKYNKIKDNVKSRLDRTSIGKSFARAIKKIKGSIKQFVVPGMLFEEMGVKYMGPIDGHNIKEVSKVLKMAQNADTPVLIHIVTTKGKGYDHAEKNPGKFHSMGPFDCDSGEATFPSGMTYSRAFGEELVNLAKEDERIVAITAAMRDGTGLLEFSKQFKNRFFDVGIAEQHAVTMAAGMASNGLKPVFAVYSTFLQRAYDQVIHDVCMQKLPVVFAIDRAGLVGDDGETHQGIFDISFLSHMPNLMIMSPKSVEELRYMLKFALKQNQPIAIRYPRGGDSIYRGLPPVKKFIPGKWETICEEGNIVVFAVGNMLQQTILVKEKLNKMGIKISIVNACFIKPIDIQLINHFISKNFKVVTIEENVISGGLGSTVLKHINSMNSSITVMNLGFKDEFVEQGRVDILYKLCGLDVSGITSSILDII